MLGSIINYHFNNPCFAELALTHSSVANEKKSNGIHSNERLEFLGDAVLELAVSKYLYHKYPELSEGELTKLRASVVCEPMLAKRAKLLNLGQELKISRGDEMTGGRDRESTLADLFEAVIGAVYLDGGFDEAERFIINELEGEIHDMRSRFMQADAKTTLQEVLQRNGPVTITYSVVSESGPEHNKTFTVNVSLNGNVLGCGTGRNKKEAEQHAAAEALGRM
jgi:ribonuclease-3